MIVLGTLTEDFWKGEGILGVERMREYAQSRRDGERQQMSMSVHVGCRITVSLAAKPSQARASPNGDLSSREEKVHKAARVRVMIQLYRRGHGQVGSGEWVAG